jgi:putative DNA primase/helicase
MTGDRPPRPDAVTVDPDGVPETLRELDLWLVWRYEWKDDRDEWAKIPKDGAGGGYRIDATAPDNGVAFDTAVKTYQTGDCDGLGIITDPDEHIVGWDWDDVRDPDQPHESVPNLVTEMIDTLDSYIEVSPSETGYRGFVIGAKPDGPNRADLPCDPVLDETPHLEVYDGSGGRYLTVTGQHVSGTPETVETRAQEVTELYEEYIATDESPKPTGDGGIVATQNDKTPRVDAPEMGPRDTVADLSDDELLDRARNAENGEKFRRLWNGDTGGYPSHSEARQALARACHRKRHVRSSRVWKLCPPAPKPCKT